MYQRASVEGEVRLSPITLIPVTRKRKLTLAAAGDRTVSYGESTTVATAVKITIIAPRLTRTTCCSPPGERPLTVRCFRIPRRRVLRKNSPVSWTY